MCQPSRVEQRTASCASSQDQGGVVLKEDPFKKLLEATLAVVIPKPLRQRVGPADVRWISCQQAAFVNGWAQIHGNLWLFASHGWFELQDGSWCG